MQAYKHLLKVHGVQDFRAVATSAMRGGERIGIGQIRESTGIDIQIIDGAKKQTRIQQQIVRYYSST